MALSKDLPIYKATYDLTLLSAEMTRNMPRDFKASLGKEIRDECVAVVLLIYRANCAKDKVPHLDELLERVQVLELQLRLARDMRLISTKHYAQAVELTDSVGKQTNGWRKNAKAASPVV